MDAFAGAVELGFRHLETDLHMTADGVLVCLHDPTVDRTTEGSGRVQAMTLGELQRLDAGHRHTISGDFPFRGMGVRVPTLEEVVTSFPEVALVLDLKMGGMASTLARLIDRHSLHERVIVGSIRDSRIAEFREAAGSRVPTSVGRAWARLWLLASRSGRAGPGMPEAIHLPVRTRGLRPVDRRLVAAATLSGAQVHVWTVNRREEMIEMLDVGAGGIISDRPDLLKQTLTERGEWRV
jgi:glycerophosphoryl diester phosphodiesterase